MREGRNIRGVIEFDQYGGELSSSALSRRSVLMRWVRDLLPGERTDRHFDVPADGGRWGPVLLGGERSGGGPAGEQNSG